jgi:hypothetical protein
MWMNILTVVLNEKKYLILYNTASWSLVYEKRKISPTQPVGKRGGGTQD